MSTVERKLSRIGSLECRWCELQTLKRNKRKARQVQWTFIDLKNNLKFHVGGLEPNSSMSINSRRESWR